MLIIVIVAVSMLFGCAAPSKESAPEPVSDVVSVEVTRLAPQTWHQTIRTFGVIEAAEKVTVAAEASGKVTGVYFNDGDEISAGHKLITFDMAERRMRVKEADGNLAGVRAKLEEARTIAARREELFRQKTISKEQLEMARATLAGVEADFEKLLVGRSLARHQLSRTRLVSPVSGKVVSKNIDVGEVAMPGQTLAVIHVTDTMRVTTYVTEEEINTIQIGAECIVTTPGVRGRAYKAYVETAADVGDPVTGNFAVKLTVKNSDGLLRSGMTAIVALKGLAVKDTLLIPERAVVDRNRKKVVFLAKGEEAAAVEPVLAATTEEMIPVLHGLKSGDALIVGGLSGVTEGTKLTVTREVSFSELLPTPSVVSIAPSPDENTDSDADANTPASDER
jgi:RND family efflux transporter MFP subunit